MDHGPSMIPS